MAHSGSRRRTGAHTALAVAVGALLGAPGTARAVPEGHAEVRLGLQRFDYAEYDRGGVFLDGEKGFVPALSGALEVRFDRAFAGAAVRLAHGSVDYDGHTQGSGDPNVDGLPLRTTTDATFVSGALEGGLLVGPRRTVALLVAAGARRWSRDIQATTVSSRAGQPTEVVGLSEIYAWYELAAGVRWTFLERPGTSWDVEARVTRTVSAEISVDLAGPFGVDQTARMGLGARIGGRVGSSFRQDLQPGTFLVVGLWAEEYAFGASEPFVLVDAGGITRAISEPRSRTYDLGLDLGIGGRF